MTKNIVVVDYHKGNLSSVERGLDDAGASALISDKPADIESADGVVIPGVGAFADAMAFMNESGQAEALRTAIAQGKPFLGICLGTQLMFDRGCENVPQDGSVGFERDGVYWVEGLGFLKGACVRLPEVGLKVPHVGWNQVSITEAGQTCALLTPDMDGRNFYFTHSYVSVPEDPEVIAATTDYAKVFPSIVCKGNAFGCQFHPEKSSRTGALIMQRFVELV
ncbi:imidazole glycerol phosphate synthase subunit HisH [Slackia heliotrinireducens]|uniref:imidazole glycerol phosphate synthase subunit HisH n=1 Tax=Slackia heliotrinireducens TaxID=84110 RepID=UPI003314DD2E